jgi:LCP family protein required for cell wall assembly
MTSNIKKFIFIIILVIIVVVAIIVLKGARTISVVSENGSLFAPKTDKRWDILLLGNRGDKAENGGILTDSIMVVSYKPDTGDLALISIPRDLWVKIPGYGQEKINAAYSIGKEKGKGKTSEGLKMAKEVVSNITGLEIDFTAVCDIEALKNIVDTIGGITIYEDKSFYSDFYGYKVKIKKGKNDLNGSQTLAYIGIRDIDSDFGRMERQQKALLAIKDKVFSLNIISNPKKVLSILNTLEGHLRTDLNSSQIEYLAKQLPKMEVNSTQRIIFDDTNYLYASHSQAGAYILLPKEGNFSEIQKVCENVFGEENNGMTKTTPTSTKKITNN